MLFVHRQFVLSFFWSLFVLALSSANAAEGPQPGDVFDYNSHVFPQWWYDLRDQYAYKEVRKCPFLTVIPDTYDSCPGVAKELDHYYCIFGTDEKPTWYCTCMESVNGETDFKFYCGTEIVTFDSVEYPHATEMVDEGGAMMSISNVTTRNETIPISLQDDADGAGGSVGDDGVTEGPKPGDAIDVGSGQLPTWWTTLRDQYEYKEVRQCPFLTTIPDTFDSCPGVSKELDHYYCIFGTAEKATWFCTCIERINGEPDYHFYCGSEIVSPDNIEYPLVTTTMTNDDIYSEIALGNANDTSKNNTISVGNNVDGPDSSDGGGDDGAAEGPQPGDAIEVGSDLPTWWTTIRDQFAYKEVRQCPFLTTIPDTFDSCPGVSKELDHYYCIFGTAEKATWFCTCVERINGEPDYHFYCGSEIVPPDDIEFPLVTTTMTNDDKYSESILVHTNPEDANATTSPVDPAAAAISDNNTSSRSGSQSTAGVFVSGFFTGIAVMLALLAAAFYFLSRRKRRFQEKPLKPNPDDYYSSDGVIGLSNKNRDFISTKELM